MELLRFNICAARKKFVDYIDDWSDLNLFLCWSDWLSMNLPEKKENKNL